MIPKVIHYCWFGKNPKNEIIEKCIASWRENCPDWEIIEWNEDNWDVNAHPFAKSAYEAGKWAFVSDYARLDVLYKNGGVYLDTDVEILQLNPLDSYLQYTHILAFENARGIATGLLFGASKNSRLCAKLLEPYDMNKFDAKNLQVNTAVNRPVLCTMFPDIKWNGQTQVFGTDCIMGCDEYGSLMKHYGTRTWCEDLPSYKVSGDMWIKRVVRNPAIFERLESSSSGRTILPVYTFLSYDLLDMGPAFYFKLLYLKLKNPRKK